MNTTTSRPALTPIQYQILIALIGEPLHGYHVINVCNNDSRGAIKVATGTMYPILRRMSQAGLIKMTEEQKGNGSANNRQLYTLTSAGLEAIEEETLRLEHATEIARSRIGYNYPQAPPSDIG